jgi:hypothetical protein
MFLFAFCFYCCCRWGYIVAFTKVLTKCQIYHTWIHPLHDCPLFPSPIPEIVNRYHVYIYICVYSVSAPHSPSYTFPHHLPLPMLSTPHAGPVPPSSSLICRRKKKRKKKCQSILNAFVFHDIKNWVNMKISIRNYNPKFNFSLSYFYLYSHGYKFYFPAF